MLPASAWLMLQWQEQGKGGQGEEQGEVREQGKGRGREEDQEAEQREGQRQGGTEDKGRGRERMGGREEEKEGEKEVEEEQGLKGRHSSCPRPLAPLLQARLEAPVSKPGPHTCSQRECHIKERQDRMTRLWTRQQQPHRLGALLASQLNTKRKSSLFKLYGRKWTEIYQLEHF